MLLVREVKQERRKPTKPPASEELMERLRQSRSDIPVVNHVDYSARIQTVEQTSNPRYRQLLDACKKLTGYGMLVNTSFNIKDEPIVCAPDDAIYCFLVTHMDVLVIENFIARKEK